ncbi:MAG: hypothetical protein E7Z92_06610 [Cyanobacteria bacterium SIG31]|nr:hypothetical protein [Cyanobacteria bacterium SIG31]
MELVNLLEFLNKSKELYAPSFATSDIGLVNFLDIIAEDKQFTQKIDLGVIFVSQRTLNQYVVVDGFSRLLSLSLLLHAVCECYKKTSEKNDKAIKTIRSKYLLNDSKTKLRMSEDCQVIYDKLIFGERLSGKEKKSPVFTLMHALWSQIKEESLQAGNIFTMLQRIVINLVETENICTRDLYYTLNKEKRELNQYLLIDSYMNSLALDKEWNSLKKVFRNREEDINLFFKDFFITKFSFKEYQQNRLYEIFTNYFETMLQYISKEALCKKLKRSAEIYKDILNVNMPNEKLRDALIQIKMHNGADTYAYLLNIYEDYLEDNISEATFYEILLTIDEYLKNRQKTPNNVGFNELIQYLNAFITCK